MKKVLLIGYFIVLLVFASASEISQPETSEDKLGENVTSTEGHTNSSRTHERSYSGDSYFDGAYNECFNTKRKFSCFKYKALRYLHKILSPSVDNSLVSNSEGLNIMGSTIRLVSIPENTAASKEYVKTLFPDSQPRSSDSELEGLYKFTLREAENFLRTHALTLRIPTGSATSRDIDAGQNPRIVDEDHPEKDLQDEDATTEGRGKKKKAALLLPLLLFLKLKALLVPILLGVLFIKKLLILAAILLPSLLSFIKLCKPSHGHSYSGWVSAPDISGDYSSGYSHSGGYHGDYHGRRSSRWAPHSMAYRGYHRANEEHTGV